MPTPATLMVPMSSDPDTLATWHQPRGDRS